MAAKNTSSWRPSQNFSEDQELHVETELHHVPVRNNVCSSRWATGSRKGAQDKRGPGKKGQKPSCELILAYPLLEANRAEERVLPHCCGRLPTARSTAGESFFFWQSAAESSGYSACRGCAGFSQALQPFS